MCQMFLDTPYVVHRNKHGKKKKKEYHFNYEYYFELFKRHLFTIERVTEKETLRHLHALPKCRD